MQGGEMPAWIEWCPVTLPSTRAGSRCELLFGGLVVNFSSVSCPLPIPGARTGYLWDTAQQMLVVPCVLLPPLCCLNSNKTKQKMIAATTAV